MPRSVLTDVALVRFCCPRGGDGKNGRGYHVLSPRRGGGGGVEVHHHPLRAPVGLEFMTLDRRASLDSLFCVIYVYVWVFSSWGEE